MKRVTVSIAMMVVLATTSCNLNNTQKGAGIGAAGGAILGGIIGNQIGSGHSEVGAIIGGVLGGATGAAIGNKMDKQAQQIEQEVPGAKVERVNNGEAIQVIFDGESGGVQFPTGQYSISNDSKNTLDKLISVLQQYPDTDITVAGHTDDVGQDASNMTLSKNRAQSVSSYLTSNGINGSRITTKYFGETQPKVANDSPENRAINRRVEIYITPNDKMIQDTKNGL